MRASAASSRGSTTSCGQRAWASRRRSPRRTPAVAGRVRAGDHPVGGDDGDRCLGSAGRSASSRAVVTGQSGHQTATVRGGAAGCSGEGTAGYPVRAVRSSTGATGCVLADPSSRNRQPEGARPGPSRRPATFGRDGEPTLLQPPVPRADARPLPGLSRQPDVGGRPGVAGRRSAGLEGHQHGVSIPRSSGQPAHLTRHRPGGRRSATMSTASSRAPTAEVQLEPGWGTMASRCRSRPYSTAASALMVGRPTSAHHAPSADAAEISASSSDTEPPTLIVLPRRRPSGSRGDSAEWTGNAGATRWLRSTAMEPSSLRTATSSTLVFSNVCSTQSSAWHPF